MFTLVYSYQPSSSEVGLVETPCNFVLFCFVFFLTTFYGNRICNLYLPYNISFHKYASKLGGVVWVGEVVKIVGRGGFVNLHYSYFCL